MQASKLSIAALALLLLAAGVLVVRANESPAGAPRLDHLGLEIDVQPAESPAGAFLAQAKLTDLDSGEVVSAPRVLFPDGEEAMIRTGVMPGAEIVMKVQVDAGGTRASYHCEVLRGGEVVLTQQATFRLAG